MKIPANNIWSQTNQGDLAGILNESRNINLDSFGKVTLGKKSFVMYSSDDDVDLNNVMSIKYYNNKYIIVTTDGIFSADTVGGALSQIASSPNTTTDSDAEVIFGNLYVTIDNNLSYWNGSTWTNSVEALTGSTPHPMTTFDSLPTYKLAIGNGSSVIVSDGTGGTGTSLSLPSQHIVTALAYRNGYLFVGTYNDAGGEAKIYVWDGSTANANYEIPVGANQVFSLVPYKSTVAAMLSDGRLIGVNGTSSILLGALPVYYKPNIVWDVALGAGILGRVSHRGMVSVGDRIYINVNGSLENGFIPEMKSGIWAYDPNFGLYHYASYTTDQLVSDNGLSVTNSVITTSAAHNLKTGDAVEFSTTSGLSGVDSNVPYYVSVQSTTTIKLAKSRLALKNNDFVTITGTAGLTDTLFYIPNTQWCGERSPSPGAISATSSNTSILTTWESPIIWGGRCDKPDGTQFFGVFGLTDSWNVGSITTQRVYSQQITDVWQKIYTFLDGLSLSTEEVVLKIKTHSETSKPSTLIKGYWSSATEIHSDATTFDEDEWRDINKGDEIYIIDGTGRGYTAHVTKDITETTNTFVVTVDESIGTANDVVWFFVDNKTKVTAFTEANKDRTGYLEVGLDEEKTPWIMITAEMRGFQTQVSHFELSNKNFKNGL